MRTSLIWASTLIICDFLLFRAAFAGDSADLLLHLNSQGSISFTSSQSSFELTLPSYLEGSTSQPAEVSYSIMANDVGRLEDLVLVRLAPEIEGIALEARMGTFVKQGGTARLVANASDFIALSAQEQGVLDKAIDEGEGRIVDGNLTLLYRARALQDLEAGRHEATLIVSFADN